jgi:hypothetical protein
MNQSTFIEAEAAATRSFLGTRRRPQSVRRYPIEVNLGAAEGDVPTDGMMTVAALEAILRDANSPATGITRSEEPAFAASSSSPPEPQFSPQDQTSQTATANPMPTSTKMSSDPSKACGVSSEQVHVWLAQLRDDLHQVQIRIHYLQLEQQRLQQQQRLVIEMLASSTPA